MHKKATTIQQQIQILKNRNLTITDEEKAQSYLLDIGYYRLGFYLFPFDTSYDKDSKRTDQYKKGTTLTDAVLLYYFDVDLRHILSKYIHRIEVNLRTYITYTLSNQYIESPTWFANEKYVTKQYTKDFHTKVYNENFKKIPAIQKHHQKHQCDYAPAWKTLEFMTLGAIITLFHNINDNEIKLHIANHYGFRAINAFSSYLNALKIIRNKCAHTNVLFDITLNNPIANGPSNIPHLLRPKLAGAILAISHLLSIISQNRADEMTNDLQNLYEINSQNPKINNILTNTTHLPECIKQLKLQKKTP